MTSSVTSSLVDHSAWQPTMWSDGPGIDGAGAFKPIDRQARRVLTDGAWIDYVPSWIRSPDDLFAQLAQHVPWQADRRKMYDSVVAVPRLTAWYEGASAAPHPMIAEAMAALCDHYRAGGHDPFVSAGLCLYRTGTDSVAWHGDRIGRGAHHDTLVAVVSLGSPRSFLLRPRGGGRSLKYTVGHGDLLVMGGTCQRTWDHAVPKSRHGVGARISVQYRPAGVA